MSRLRQRYEKEVVPGLKKEFGYDNVMAIPKITKVVVNMGLGEATQNAKIVDTGADELGRITGQKPVITRAKKSIAQFKVRKGMPIGTMVTLRGERMWEFLDRLISVAIPRIRDFRGLNPRSFDRRGNYSLGIREQLIFPEIDYDSIDEVRGLDVTITTTAKTDEEAFELLRALGLPFSAEGRPGEEDLAAAEEEERRKEEARQRAEAEQAALEQLKEERPEAYERKPREEEEEEEGEEVEGEGLPRRAPGAPPPEEAKPEGDDEKESE
jgi:large subunit ribosomal protein L5